MKFNLNSFVKIKLTSCGKEILHNRRKDLYNKIGQPMPEYSIVEDEDGWSRWQLWEVMSIFGNHLYMGASQHPFGLEIDIPIMLEEAKCK